MKLSQYNKMIEDKFRARLSEKPSWGKTQVEIVLMQVMLEINADLAERQLSDLELAGANAVVNKDPKDAG